MEKKSNPAQWKSALLLLKLNNVLTPMTTQSYLPIAPLLVTEGMGKDPFLFGQMLTVMVIGSLFSFAAMQPLLQKYSARDVLLFDFFLRTVSGLLWMLPCLLDMGGSTVFLLFLSRFVYGLTLNSFAIPMAWVGVRLPAEERPQLIAMLGGLVGLGITIGPTIGVSFGSICQLVLPNIASRGMLFVGYASPGIFTVIASPLLFGMTWFMMNDPDPLTPTAPPASSKGPETEEKKADIRAGKITAWLNLAANFTMCAAFLAGFESTMPLQMKHAYGWDMASSWVAWVPFGVFSLVFSLFIIPTALDRLNAAKVAVYGACFGSLSLLGINWFNFHMPVPPWLFIVENFFGNGFAMIGQCLAAQMVVKLQPAEQVKFQGLIAFSSQVGRAVGPLASTWVFETAESVIGGPGSGANMARVWMLITGFPPIIVAFSCFFKEVFGRFTDLSPYEIKQGKKNAPGSEKAML